MPTNKLISLILLSTTLFIFSCEDSSNDIIDNNNISINVSDFTINIDENPTLGQSLGVVNASTNQGALIFSVTQQSPNQAVEINSSTGEITVLMENLFDYETHPTITGIIRVENGGVSNTSTMTITLNDVNEIVDDYNLLAVSDLGEIFEIGNNTGDIQSVGQINRENENSILSHNNLIASNEKIYAIEYVYNPSPTNNLLIYDKQNNTTQIVPLTLPQNITGDERGIVSLALDGNNLIGVLSENILINNFTEHIISINLQDNSVSDLGITFNEDTITSMKKINSKLYISTWSEGFIEIDLINNSVNKIDDINGSRMARINDSELAIMQPVSGFFNGAKPEIINLSNQTISNNFDGEVYGLATVFGNSIYQNNVYLNLISSSAINLYFGILKTNFENNQTSIVEINSDDVNRNLIIVDITN